VSTLFALLWYQAGSSSSSTVCTLEIPEFFPTHKSSSSTYVSIEISMTSAGSIDQSINQNRSINHINQSIYIQNINI
jgi:hypothetical protein